MLSTWSYGFAVIDAWTALADAGLAAPRRYVAVLDELWRVLWKLGRRLDDALAVQAVRDGRMRRNASDVVLLLEAL